MYVHKTHSTHFAKSKYICHVARLAIRGISGQASNQGLQIRRIVISRWLVAYLYRVISLG
jgi:hypothetical protein